MSELIKVGISHGDTNGISYELLLKTFSDERLTEILNPIIYGSSKSASYNRKVLNCKPVNFNIVNQVEQCAEGKVNLINCIRDEIKIELGKPSPEAGKAAFMSLSCAVEDLRTEKIDVLVTLPINKDSIQCDDFKFPGHTEYLEESFATGGEKSLMMLIGNSLRIALVTGHLPISEIPKHISQTDIVEKIGILNQSLQRDFGISAPRIAVLSLNPHCGENGLLGKEESEIIEPAIKQAQDAGILCVGPMAADGFFGADRHKEFDAILAMYHDQGLIPFKTLSMETGVNFTAGLPIVRTSPAHGTAYNIAGKGEASDESFRQAIYMAVDIFKNRKMYDEARANPLHKMYFDRGKDDEKLDLTAEE